MSDHIPDLTKMIGDTPISDSTPHNVADLGMLCRKLERELNRACEMYRKLDIHTLNLVDRIRRLEEAGDAMVNEGWNEPHLANAWRKAKEEK
jgi:hypothetical protein